MSVDTTHESWPTAQDLLNMVGFDGMTPAMRENAAVSMRATLSWFTEAARERRLPDDGSCPEDAKMGLLLHAAETLHQYGVGSVVTLNEATLDVAAQRTLKNRYLRSYVGGNSPFPTLAE